MRTVAALTPRPKSMRWMAAGATSRPVVTLVRSRVTT